MVRLHLGAPSAAPRIVVEVTKLAGEMMLTGAVLVPATLLRGIGPYAFAFLSENSLPPLELRTTIPFPSCGRNLWCIGSHKEPSPVVRPKPESEGEGCNTAGTADAGINPHFLGLGLGFR